jgi:hypothetical protein
MRPIVFFALGFGFILMGVGLWALTLIKAKKPMPSNPNKSQLREQAVLAEEKKKMYIAAAGISAIGVVTMVCGLF